jgi:dolichyl-phosphate beta-glucosyltransferase
MTLLEREDVSMMSVIIAAYNEEKRLPGTLCKIADYLNQQGIQFEIIIVDDGSTDQTSGVSRKFASLFPNISIIGYEINKGKGYALRTGVLASRGDFVLLTDADLSTPIEELSRLLPFLKENACELAIGTRALELSRIIRKQPWWRQCMGRIFNRIVRYLVLDGFSDTQCGFKLFTGEVARRLFGEARINRFAFDVEILALALKRRYRVLEMPITWINSPASKVRPVLDSLRMLRDLARIRIAIREGQRHVHASMMPAEPALSGLVFASWRSGLKPLSCTLPQPLPSKGGEHISPLPWWERARERGGFADGKKQTGQRCGETR